MIYLDIMIRIMKEQMKSHINTKEISRLGKRGTFVIPAPLLRRFGLEEGCVIIAEACDEGILLRPAATLTLEIYTKERQAEFLLSNAVDADDYERAVEEVRKMGLKPDSIEHFKPISTDDKNQSISSYQ